MGKNRSPQKGRNNTARRKRKEKTSVKGPAAPLCGGEDPQSSSASSDSAASEYGDDVVVIEDGHQNDEKSAVALACPADTQTATPGQVGAKTKIEEITGLTEEGKAVEVETTKVEVETIPTGRPTPAEQETAGLESESTAAKKETEERTEQPKPRAVQDAEGQATVRQSEQVGPIKMTTSETKAESEPPRPKPAEKQMTKGMMSTPSDEPKAVEEETAQKAKAADKKTGDVEGAAEIGKDHPAVVKEGSEDVSIDGGLQPVEAPVAEIAVKDSAIQKVREETKPSDSTAKTPADVPAKGPQARTAPTGLKQKLLMMQANRRAEAKQSAAASGGAVARSPASNVNRQDEIPVEKAALLQSPSSRSPKTTSLPQASEVIESEPSAVQSLEAVSSACSSPRKPATAVVPSPRGECARAPTDVESEAEADAPKGRRRELRKIAEHDAREQKANAETQALEKKLKDLEEKYERRLEKQSEDYRQALQNLEVELTKMRDSLSKAEKEKSACEADIRTLRAALEELEARFNLKIEECKGLVSASLQVKEFNQELIRKSEELQSRETALKEDRMALEALQNKLVESQKRLAQEGECSAKISSENEATQAKLRAESDQLRNRELTLRRLESELEARSKDFERQQQIADAEHTARRGCFVSLLVSMGLDESADASTTESLREALDAWRAAREREKCAAQETASRLEAEAKQAEEALRKKDGEIEKLNEYGQGIKRENVQCHANITELNQEVFGLKNRLNLLERSEQELTTSLGTALRAKERWEKAHREVSVQLEEAQRALETSRQDNKSRSDALRRAENELDHAQREIRALQEDIAVRDIANAALTQTVGKLKSRPFFSRLINQD